MANYSKTAEKLLPHLLQELSQVQPVVIAAAGSGGAMAVHAIDGAYHSGTLAESQAPWAVTTTTFATHEGDASAHHAPVTVVAPAASAPLLAPVAGVSDRFAAGVSVHNVTNSRVNVRTTPGYLGKPASDIVGQVDPGAAMTVLGDSQSADNLVWWRIRYQDPTGAALEGWVAEATASGVQILA